jgi:hypothetical protein
MHAMLASAAAMGVAHLKIHDRVAVSFFHLISGLSLRLRAPECLQRFAIFYGESMIFRVR